LRELAKGNDRELNKPIAMNDTRDNTSANDQGRLTGGSFRHIFKDMALYGTGDLVFKATSFFAIPIYTRFLTPGDYGVWSFVVTAVGLLGGVLILGGDSAFSLFFFEARTETEKQRVTSTWFGFLFAWSVAVIVLCLPFVSVFSTWSFSTRDHAILFALALMTAPLSLINAMCGQALRSQFQPRLFLALSVCSALLSIGFSLWGVVVLKLGLRGLMGGALLASSLMLPVRLWTIRGLLRPIFSACLLRRLLAFGIPLVPSSLAYWVFGMSDRIVLGKLSTLDQVGLYTLAVQITGILTLITGAWGQAWSPHAVKAYIEQPTAAPAFFGRAMTYILFGFGFLSVVFGTFAKEVLVVFSTPSFYPAASAIGPLGLGIVAYASTQVTATGISFAKKTTYFAVVSWIAALMNLGLNVLLIPKWGMMAACWTTTASYLFLTVIYLVLSQKMWAVAYEKKRAYIIIGATFSFTVFASHLPELPLVFSLLMKTLYVAVFLGLVFASKALDRREWHGILAFIQHRKTMKPMASWACDRDSG
jgi:O-antigen/teichoic acid export membrane protein